MTAEATVSTPSGPAAERVERLFRPRAVTLVGATPNSHVTRVLLANFERADRPFPGPVHLVNPTRPEVLGRRAAPSLAEVEGDLGLVYLLVRADACRPVLDQAADAGLTERIDGVVVYAAGFGEAGNTEAQEQLVASAQRLGVPMLGPQSTGLISARAGLVGITDPVPEQFVPGRVGFVAQSTGLLGGAVSWLMRRGIGIGQAVGYGNGASTAYPELASAMLRDPDIEVVCVYVDAVAALDGIVTLGRLSTQLGKPVVLFTGARAAAAQRAARSHTGVLATSERIVRGVAEQYGVVLVDDFEELLWGAELLLRDRVRALRTGAVGIFTASGGGGIIAADSIERAGLPLPTPGRSTLDILELPDGGTANPYDIGAISLDTPTSYETKLRAYAADPVFDIVARPASLGAPSEALADHTRSLRLFIDGVQAAGKMPMIVFPYPEDPRDVHPLVRDGQVLVAGGSAELAGKLRLIRQWVRRPSEAADPPPAPAGAGAPAGESVIADERTTGALLATTGVHRPAGVTVDGPAGLPAALAELGWDGGPLVAKTSRLLPHRAREGGVLLGLRGRAELEAATALLTDRFGAPVRLDQQLDYVAAYFVGMRRLPDGHCVLAFGGGVATDESEVALRLCPLDAASADRLLDTVLGDRPAGLADVLIRLSRLGPDHPELDVVDLNPLVRTADRRLVALDAKAYVQTPPDARAEQPWT